jgi:pilus assembly protein CpaB
MTPRILVLVALSLIAAAGAAYMTNSWLETERRAAAEPTPQPPAPEPDYARVLVADGALAAGTILQRSHLRWHAWPEDGVLDSFVVRGPETSAEPFVGAVVRASLVDGEPVTDARVVRPGDRGFLAAMVGEGHRALSVPVNAASGISGLIFPGDRVDVILSHTVTGEGEAARTRQASETVLADIRVLALDQRTDDVAGERVVAKTATLEVTPKEAETLSLAQRLGNLSLSLRPLAGSERPARQRPTFTVDREISRVMSAGPDAGATVVVVRGSESRDVRVGE